MENLTLPQIDCKAGNSGALSLNEVSTGFGLPPPIIAQYWPGWRSFGEIAGGIVQKLAFRREGVE